MEDLAHFEICVSEERDIYHVGEDITGNVEVTLTRPMLMKCISISLSGKVGVEYAKLWDIRHPLAEVVIAFGNTNPTDERTELGSGSHSFPFHFNLRPGSPSTFKDDGAFVRYRIKASIEKPWESDHITRKDFMVFSCLDLNTIPYALTSAADFESKNLCCWCCKSGPIELEFFIDRRGYVPGEWISVYATVDNKSNRRIAKTSMMIWRKATYLVRDSSVWKMMTKMDCLGCEPGEALVLENKRILVPQLPPTERIYDGMIDVEYRLEVVANTPCSLNLRGGVEIIIGSEPFTNLPHRTGNNESASAPPASDVLSDLPPSYEEVVMQPPKYPGTQPGISFGGVTDCSNDVTRPNGRS